MANKHLLTCECGTAVAVGVNQAGSQITCPCGVQLEVPPLRKLRELPVDESELVEESSNWSLRKAVVATAVVIAGLCAVLGIWQLVTLPELPTFDSEANLSQYQQFLDSATPTQLYRHWYDIQQMFPNGEFRSMDAPIIDAIKQQRNRQWMLGVVAFSAAAFILLMGVVAWFSMPAEQKPDID